MARRKSIKKQMEEEKNFEPVETMDALDMVDQSNKPVDESVQEEPVDISDKFVEIKKEKTEPKENKCLYFVHEGKTYKKTNDRIAICCTDGSIINIPKGE